MTTTKIPEKIHNKRFPKQWEIITEHLDFEGKTVVDVGCGHGDLIFHAYQAGAREVIGIEQDSKIAIQLQNYIIQNKLEKQGHSIWVSFANIEQNTMRPHYLPNKFDIGVCFSVLPYLDDPDEVMRWLLKKCNIVLVEVQYAGDGPGWDHIKEDLDMAKYLEKIGFEEHTPIGTTLVKDRDKERTIWMCTT